MRKFILLMILIAPFSGCISSEIKSPVSRIPQILMDYVNETEIYIFGTEIYKFTYAKITVEWENETYVAQENETYFLKLKTKLKNFMLNTSVLDGKNIYNFKCEVEVMPDEETAFLIKEGKKETKVKSKELPWKKMLNKGEEWK
ncbi:MAG: hypothetical protein AB1779_07790 [Candidatus Thermoplasmatota archaeon]